MSPRVLLVEQLANSVFIKFHDGRSALFPATLLHASCDLAMIMSEELEEVTEEPTARIAAL